MKSNNRKLFLLPLLTLSLSSCNGGIRELYDQYDYNGALFTDNYYEVWDSDLVDVKSPISYEVDYIKSLSELKTKYYEKGLKEKYKVDDFVSKTNKDTETGNYSDLIWNTSGTVISESAPNGVETYFGATQSLSFGRNGNSEFAHGITSKLFDGRVSCSGYKALSRIQIGENGFGSELPLKLQSQDYLVLALRGATDSEGGFHTSVEIDLNLSFYVMDEASGKYQPYTFVYKDLPVTVDNRQDAYASFEEESQTQCISFFFDEIEGFNANSIKDASAFSFTYTLHENRLMLPLTTDKTEAGTHFGLMLYEMMLPNSLWK